MAAVAFAYQDGKVADSHIMGAAATVAECETRAKDVIKALESRVPDTSFAIVCVPIPDAPAVTTAPPHVVNPDETQKETSL